MKLEYTIDLLSGAVSLLGFIVTIILIQKNTNEKRINSIIEIKKLLEKYDEIHQNLLPGGSWSSENGSLTVMERSALYSYLGVFEVCYFMIDKGTLKKEEFEVFFKYRLANLRRNKMVWGIVEQEGQYWEKLIALVKKFNLK